MARRFHSTLHGERGGIERPIDRNPNHPSSDYWTERLSIAMAIININPQMLAVWDSDLIPDWVPYRMIHALLAEKIVEGKIVCEPAIVGIATEVVYGEYYDLDGKDYLDLKRTQENARL